MSKRTLLACAGFGLIAAVFFADSAMAGHYMPVRREIRSDRGNIHRDRAELRRDIDEFHRDRDALRRAYRRGASPDELARRRAELRDDFREIHQDRWQLRRDFDEFHRDRGRYGWYRYPDRPWYYRGSSGDRWDYGRFGRWNHDWE